MQDKPAMEAEGWGSKWPGHDHSLTLHMASDPVNHICRMKSQHKLHTGWRDGSVGKLSAV